MLIVRLKQGQRSAFDVLVQQYRQRGFAICYNLVGSPEDAQDVLQDAFIKVYRNIKNFREDAAFSTWFYRILTNCSLDFLRKKKVLSKHFTGPLIDEEGKEQDIADSHSEPVRILSAQEFARNLDLHIEQLPEKQKVCFILKHQNRLSNQEIAQTLGCSLGTVKVHLFRAVRALQRKLSVYSVQ
ncbi:MAG: sigma-70 family RNA polymerase sigma factor [Candidatus Omnitrophota bacterium]